MERFVSTDIFRKESNTFQAREDQGVDPLLLSRYYFFLGLTISTGTFLPFFFFVRVASTRLQRESAKHRFHRATEMLFMYTHVVKRVVFHSPC